MASDQWPVKERTEKLETEKVVEILGPAPAPLSKIEGKISVAFFASK